MAQGLPPPQQSLRNSFVVVTLGITCIKRRKKEKWEEKSKEKISLKEREKEHKEMQKRSNIEV